MTKMTIIIIPTYNERENLEELLPGIFSFAPDVHVVVIDSSSTDSTGTFLAQKAVNNPLLHWTSRDFPDGRGAADLDGFRFALENNFEFIIQMDADMSHHPRYIPQMLAALQSCDVVIGSRLIPGSQIGRRSLWRNLLTPWANIYIRSMLGIKVRDCTSGFRGFRQTVLHSLDLSKMLSQGPANLIEILYACHKKNFIIREIPIIFSNRRKGQSKLRFYELLEAAFTIVRIKKKYAH